MKSGGECGKVIPEERRQSEGPEAKGVALGGVRSSEGVSGAGATLGRWLVIDGESSQGLQHVGPFWTVGGTWECCVDVGMVLSTNVPSYNRCFKTLILSLICT